MNEENKIKSFTDLYVWQEAHTLVLDIYNVTKKFPREELIGLVSQMRRAAVSITSNIAEGFSRGSYKDKVHFYLISKGSVTELQDQILISRDIGYILKDDFLRLSDKITAVHKILSGLIKKSRTFII